MPGPVGNYASQALALQSFARGASPRKEGTIKSINAFPYYTQTWTDTTLPPSDAAGKPTRNPGETFLNEFRASEVKSSFNFMRRGIPEGQFQTIMDYDYQDNTGKTRWMRSLAARRDADETHLTFASDTIGDGKGNNYYNLNLRDNRSAAIIEWRNGFFVAMVPTSADTLATGAVGFAMPRAEMAKWFGLSSNADLRAIATAIYATNIGAQVPDAQFYDNQDRSYSVKAASKPQAGSVEIVQLDTSWGTDTDMVVAMLNNVDTVSERILRPQRIAPNLSRLDVNGNGLLTFVRDGWQNLRNWLGHTGVDSFYTGANRFIVRRTAMDRLA